MDIVLKEQEERVVYLTLNRPEKRNALSVELIDALKTHFAALAEDVSVRVIVLKATGEAFCAGADLGYLQQLQKNTFEESKRDSDNLAQLFKLIYTHPKIVIAQVEGAALAGGSGLATVCDLCYATPESKFGYTEVKIGFIPAIVSCFLLRKIGEAKAKALLLTGKIISAAQALEAGMIHEVIPADRIAEEVGALALKLSVETSPSSIQRTKNLISEVQSLGLDEALSFASEQNALARATDDCKKGIAAFLNKEKLTW